MGITRFLTLFIIILTTAEHSYALTGSDDLLRNLPEADRTAILSGATPKQLCELRVLEKDLKITFTRGKPPSDPNSVDQTNQCSSTAPKRTATISSAADLKQWLTSIYGYCEYKKRLQKGLERATKKLANNPDYGFVTDADFNANRHCFINPQSQDLWSPSSTRGSRCLAAKGNSSSALQCFYKDECRFDCWGGSHNLRMLGDYEVFAGDDGIMSDSEATLFDKYYDRIVVGQWTATSAEGGANHEMDDYEGYRINRNTQKTTKVPTKSVSLPDQAGLGEFGLTGFQVVVDTKQSYQDEIIKKVRTTGVLTQEAVEAKSNAVLISTSKSALREFISKSVEGNTATDQVVGQFEADTKVITDALLQLNFVRTNEGDVSDPTVWRAYEQVTSTENTAAIMNGTYKLRNATAKDQAEYAKIQAILSKPIYRDTKIYIHPMGVMPLGEAIINKKAIHYKAQLSFWVDETAEDDHLAKFIAARVAACGN